MMEAILSKHTSDGDIVQAEIVVAGGNKFPKSVEAFNMATKTWRPLPQMKEGRCGRSSAVYQDRMIVTGGRIVEELNLAQPKGHWIKSPLKLPFPLFQDHACVVYQNRLLVIGGEFVGEAYDTILEFQLTPPYTSRLLTKMPRPICCHGAVIINDKIFIVGGSTTGWFKVKDATNAVLVFDLTTNTCTELEPLPYPVLYMATVAWRDNVVLLGGDGDEGNTHNTVILYNVTTATHRKLPEMTKKRLGCTAVTIGDNIIVMGGFDETVTELNSVECYNFNTNTWTEFPAMTEARAFATAVVKYL